MRRMPSSSAIEQALKRPCAAVGEQHEVAGVVTAADRDFVDGLRHARDRHADDAVRHGPGFQIERRAETGDRPPRRFAVDFQTVAEPLAGTETAEHDVRVGYRRRIAALSVAGRTGIGAGRPRADHEAAARGPGGRSILHRRRWCECRAGAP